LTISFHFDISRIMEIKDATTAFAALGQDTRLQVLRLLIGAGPQGMAAGEVGARLDVLANTLSANLAVLQRAGLIRSERQGRSIRYFADFDGIGGLISFLMEDCCGGRPELCRPVVEKVVEDIACAC
jgi:ArsR family transcriptional regulator